MLLHLRVKIPTGEVGKICAMETVKAFGLEHLLIQVYVEEGTWHLHGPFFIDQLTTVKEETPCQV